MNCNDTQNLSDAYVDGELDLVRTVEIERHLEECAACSLEFNNHKALRNAIQTAPLSFKAPPRLEKRIRTSVRQAAKAQPGYRLRPNWWFTIAAPAAAAALVVLALLPLWRTPSADDLLAREIVSSHIRSLMPGHLADVASSDQHTVKPWFDGKLDFSPPVQDLAQQGFPLVGGRLDYINDRPVAALIYRRQKHFINLFVWPSESRSDVGSKALWRQGYNLFSWTKAGMTYWAVSDVEKRELQEFVRLIQGQTAPTP